MSAWTEAIRAAFPPMLRAAMRERGLTHKQLALGMRVQSGHVSKVLAGQNLPTLPTLLRVAEATGIPAWKLLRQAERMATNETNQQPAEQEETVR